MREALEISEVNDLLSGLNDWSFEENSLQREFSFDNFKEAMGFLVRLSFEAEKLDHHPEIFNVYGTVKLTLRTHDAGNRVTKLDFKLAKAIDALSA